MPRGNAEAALARSSDRLPCASTSPQNVRVWPEQTWLFAIRAHWLPDGIIALAYEQGRYRIVPSAPVFSVELNIEYVLMTLPSLIAHEVTLRRWVSVQDRLMKRRLVAHRIKHIV